jgi:2-polyprenyl-6-methoxyphenol hydroxylase-like FAD-dependent oxidoreductase
MPKKTSAPEVLVTGAGPVGLFAAALLCEKNIPFLLVEEEGRDGGLPEPILLHPWVLGKLEEIGLLEAVKEKGLPVDRLRIAREGGMETTLHCQDARHPYWLPLPDRCWREILERRLVDRGQKVHWQHRLATLEPSETGALATIEGLEEETLGYIVESYEQVVSDRYRKDFRFVIGADGADPELATVLDVPFDPKGEEFFSAVLECEAPGEREAGLFAQAERFFSCWPLPGNRCRIQLELKAPDLPALGVAREEGGIRRIGASCWEVEPERLQEELPQWLPERFSRLPVRSAVVSVIRPGMARFFGGGPVWVCGASAHGSLPFGGQDLNAGFYEAYELVSRLDRVLAGRVGGEELEEYGDERAAAWRSYFDLAGFSRKEELLLWSLPLLGRERHAALGSAPPDRASA